MGICSIDGIIVNSSKYVIEYHIQRRTNQARPVMSQLKIQPSISISQSHLDVKLLSFYKKQEYVNRDIHSFVLVPPGRACWSGLTDLPSKQCLISVYVLCMKENGEIINCRLKKDVLISSFSDARIRIRQDMSIENLGYWDSKGYKNDSKNSQTVLSLDNNFYIKLSQPVPVRRTQPQPNLKPVPVSESDQSSNQAGNFLLDTNQISVPPKNQLVPVPRPVAPRQVAQVPQRPNNYPVLTAQQQEEDRRLIANVTRLLMM